LEIIKNKKINSARILQKVIVAMHSQKKNFPFLLKFHSPLASFPHGSRKWK
jgi:hypothetical protein